MERLQEHLREAGILHTQASDYLHHVDTFRTQLQAVFVQADVERIFVALCLMTELHLVQAPRPDGSLYIEHPLAVAFQVLDAMAAKDPELVISTLLHDSASRNRGNHRERQDQKHRLWLNQPGL
jgi:(p)ppGpp synthase/HD superfamily hydrolase